MEHEKETEKKKKTEEGNKWRPWRRAQWRSNSPGISSLNRKWRKKRSLRLFACLRLQCTSSTLSLTNKELPKVESGHCQLLGVSPPLRPRGGLALGREALGPSPKRIATKISFVPPARLFHSRWFPCAPILLLLRYIYILGTSLYIVPSHQEKCSFLCTSPLSERRVLFASSRRPLAISRRTTKRDAIDFRIVSSLSSPAHFAHFPPPKSMMTVGHCNTISSTPFNFLSFFFIFLFAPFQSYQTPAGDTQYTALGSVTET